MRFRRTAVLAVSIGILAFPFVACGTTDEAGEPSIGTQPSSEPSSLEGYLLTESDFPTGSQWQHLNQEQLREQLAETEQKTPDDPICAERLRATEMKGSDVDAVAAVPRQLTMIMQTAASPTIDLAIAESAMTGRCATQTVTLPTGTGELRYTRVKTEVPDTMTFRQRTLLDANPGVIVAETLVSYMNIDDVTLCLIEVSMTDSMSSSAASLDDAEYVAILKRMAEVAQSQ